MIPEPDPNPFRRRVGRLFELLGFEVRLLPGVEDLHAVEAGGLFARSFLVRASHRATPVDRPAVEALGAAVEAARPVMGPRVRGIFVTTVGYARLAVAWALEAEVEVLTLSELEQSLVDMRAYVRRLLEEGERDPALACFVEPGLLHEQRTVAVPALAALERWLHEPAANQLTLLGDFGTGKTTLLRHLCRTLARRYEDEVVAGGARGRVPLYIDLRAYTQAISLRQIVLDLLDRNGVHLPSYAAFEHALYEGQVLLVLDGFDEMASRGNYELTLQSFRELNRSAKGKAKILLSCRSHYFTDHRDLQRFLGNPARVVPAQYPEVYREIAARPNFVIVWLQEFEPAQVDEYLRARCGQEAPEVREFIDGTYHLAELSRRPVLLEMIVTSAATLRRARASGDDPMRAGDLYEAYTDIWLRRNDWSTIIDVRSKGLLLERFAALAVGEPDLALPHARIAELVAEWSPAIDHMDAAEIDQELRAASFLVRDREGRYRFSHASFLEFFYARHLLTLAAEEVRGPWSIPSLRAEVYRFVQDLLPGRPAALEVLLRWVIREEEEEALRSNAIKCISIVRDPRVAEALMTVVREAASERVRQFAATALGHHPLPGVIAALQGVLAREDETGPVHGNALLALGRLDSHEARAFLEGLLDPAGPPLPSTWSWALMKAARTAATDQLARASLRYVLAHTEEAELVEEALVLAGMRWSPDAHALCLRLLETTTRAKVAAQAASLLPGPVPAALAPRLIAMVEVDPTHIYAERVLAALEGVEGVDLSALLVRLADAPQGTPAAVAFRLLAADYPETAAKYAARWLGPGRPYDFRLEVARTYAARRPKDGLPLLEGLLVASQRVNVKIEVLGLVRAFYPDRLAGVVDSLWAEEPVPRVKRHAVELLLQVDRAAALALALGPGLEDRRTGTRVAMCAVLAAEPSPSVTQALLERLGKDPSRWVRLQALRGLLAPGRALDPEAVIQVMREEADPEILETKRSWLGR